MSYPLLLFLYCPYCVWTNNNNIVIIIMGSGRIHIKLGSGYLYTFFFLHHISSKLTTFPLYLQEHNSLTIIFFSPSYLTQTNNLFLWIFCRSIDWYREINMVISVCFFFRCVFLSWVCLSWVTIDGRVRGASGRCRWSSHNQGKWRWRCVLWCWRMSG